MKPAYIHVSPPSLSIPETHVGPFDSLADASCYLANYPASLRKACTVFAPDAEWMQDIN